MLKKNKTKPNLSISSKFSTASGVALATTVVLLTAIGAATVRQQAIDEFAVASDNRIGQANHALEDTFGEIEQNLTFLSSAPEVLAADQSLTDYLTRGEMTADGHGPVETSIFTLFKRFGESHASIRYVDMGTKWGGFVQWPIENFPSSYDPRVRPWYKMAMTSLEKVVRPAPYLTAGSTGGISISFAKAVKNPRGDILGVAELEFSLTAFAKLVDSIHFGETGYLIVVDGSGKILIDPRDKTHEFKELERLGGGYAQLAHAPDGLATVSMDDVPYRSYVFTAPDSGWKYYALIPNDEMMAGANHLTWTLVCAGALVLVVALGLTVTLGRRMTGPLLNLSKSMYEIASVDGDMTRRLPEVSDDEVGELARQFNGFVGKLQGVLGKVLSSSRELQLAASEVSAGNGELSARTEQQAASIQQTAATMEQLAGTVRGTAAQAKNARNVVMRAVEIARRGMMQCRSLPTPWTLLSSSPVASKVL